MEEGPIIGGAYKRQLTVGLFAFLTGDFITKLWRRQDHGYAHTSYEPKRDNELHLTKGQRIKDISKVNDREGWYEVRNRMTPTYDLQLPSVVYSEKILLSAGRQTDRPTDT